VLRTARQDCCGLWRPGDIGRPKARDRPATDLPGRPDRLWGKPARRGSGHPLIGSRAGLSPAPSGAGPGLASVFISPARGRGRPRRRTSP